MDIKILDSHLREHLQTNAKPMDIAKAMSLTSASIERVHPLGKDFVYEIEITTNRPDMVAVRGIAEEAVAILPTFGFEAKLLPLSVSTIKTESPTSFPITVTNDARLTRRILAVVLDVIQKDSPQFIKDRLEAAGIRSLNNLVDITNYVMLEIGHPSHVFDADRLTTNQLVIRESKKGEKVITLDHKEYTLLGGDIVADNGKGEIIDLLGVMGTANSVVTSTTKRILFFFDNNDPWRIRKTSMGLAIRTEAAALNEKGIDPELALVALERGLRLYKDFADAKEASGLLDIYPGKAKIPTITVDKKKISEVIGVDIPVKQAITILKSLHFAVEEKASHLAVKPPSWRINDIQISEDVIEEIARVYGYHRLPTELPPFITSIPFHQATSQFFWENRAKEAFKYWGFTETYTYSTVSETLLEGPIDEAVTLKNPLDNDHVYLRRSLTPSLLQVLSEHKKKEKIHIFEIANVYLKNSKEKLPTEIRTLAFIIKDKKSSFFHIKGIVEQLALDFGIETLSFENPRLGGLGASIMINNEYLGEIEVLSQDTLCCELDFDLLTKKASLRKRFTPLAKYPTIEEDLNLEVKETISTGNIIEQIKKQSDLIVSVKLIDQYQSSRTFHITYQSPEKNLTTGEVKEIREKIITALVKIFKAEVK